jgi:ankyrin repeat protein
LFAAMATIAIRGWKPKIATIALLLAMGYGLSWHFHSLVLPEEPATQVYAGEDIFEGERPGQRLWHTSFTRLFKYVPPPPKESELQKAAQDRDLEKVRSLLRAGATVEERSRDGYSPLHLAAARDAREVAAVLLEAGATVDAGSFSSETALHYAAASGALEVAALLLSRGAAVNARSTNGATPLCHAAKRGHMAMVELLLANGADMDLKEFDMTPLYMAIMRGKYEMANYLIEKGSSVNNGELAAAARAGQKDIALTLMERGADVNQVTGGTCALILASSNGDLEMVQFLVEHGANVNARLEATRKNGPPASALDLAGSDQVRQYLLSKGAR